MLGVSVCISIAPKNRFPDIVNHLKTRNPASHPPFQQKLRGTALFDPFRGFGQVGHLVRPSFLFCFGLLFKNLIQSAQKFHLDKRPLLIQNQVTFARFQTFSYVVYKTPRDWRTFAGKKGSFTCSPDATS